MPADILAARRPHRPRNLVVLRAGDRSLHPQWLAGARRDFDLFVSYYGTTASGYADESDFHEHRPGPKWPCIAALLEEHAALVDAYDCVWFPDDDLAADTSTLNRMFACFHAHDLALAQPALTRDSYYTWGTLRQEAGCHLRYTRFVEIMAPMFSRQALAVCRRTFAESASGWGLDWVWPKLLADAALGRLAVIDATPVRHTRPCGGELYRRNPDLDPRADAARVIRKYGLQEVRAVAKYSFAGRVVDAPLPIAVRLAHLAKRLNGRRKYLLGPAVARALGVARDELSEATQRPSSRAVPP